MNRIAVGLLAIWTAGCLAVVIWAFFELPAWDTGGDFLPSGTEMFVWATVFVLFAWMLGIVVTWGVAALALNTRDRLGSFFEVRAEKRSLNRRLRARRP